MIVVGRTETEDRRRETEERRPRFEDWRRKTGDRAYVPDGSQGKRLPDGSQERMEWTLFNAFFKCDHHIHKVEGFFVS